MPDVSNEVLVERINFIIKGQELTTVALNELQKTIATSQILLNRNEDRFNAHVDNQIHREADFDIRINTTRKALDDTNDRIDELQRSKMSKNAIAATWLYILQIIQLFGVLVALSKAFRVF